MLELESDELRVAIAPEYGAEVRFLGRPGGDNVLAYYDWDAPVRGSASRSYGSSQLDFLAEYRGGWQELFPNPGAECTVLGVPLAFHGDVASAAWTVVESDGASAVVRAASRLPFVLERRMSIDGATLRIEERVTNDSEVAAPFAWGHHPAFVASPCSSIDMERGRVVADASFDSPLTDISLGQAGAWPLLESKEGRVVDLSTVPEGPVERLCYRADLTECWAAIRDPVRESGVALSWDPQAFPHIWLWQAIGSPSFPSYGRARITAIEPMSIWPSDGLAAAVERRQGQVLDPGREARAWLTLTLLEWIDRPVVGVTRSGEVSYRKEGL